MFHLGKIQIRVLMLDVMTQNGRLNLIAYLHCLAFEKNRKLRNLTVQLENQNQHLLTRTARLPQALPKSPVLAFRQTLQHELTCTKQVFHVVYLTQY